MVKKSPLNALLIDVQYAAFIVFIHFIYLVSMPQGMGVRVPPRAVFLTPHSTFLLKTRFVWRGVFLRCVVYRLAIVIW